MILYWGLIWTWHSGGVPLAPHDHGHCCLCTKFLGFLPFSRVAPYSEESWKRANSGPVRESKIPSQRTSGETVKQLKSFRCLPVCLKVPRIKPFWYHWLTVQILWNLDISHMIICLKWIYGRYKSATSALLCSTHPQNYPWKRAIMFIQDVDIWLFLFNYFPNHFDQWFDTWEPY